MENDSKFFKFLEKYLMGPLGKLAQFKVVRGIMELEWLQFHLRL